MKLIADISAFVRAPRRTGVQRVVGELLQRMTCDVTPAIAVDGRGLVALPPVTRTLIGKYFTDAGEEIAVTEGMIRGLADQAVSSGQILDLTDVNKILIPEILSSSHVAVYSAMDEKVLNKVFVIVYDLIPLLHPQYFDGGWSPAGLWPYFRFLRKIRNLSFISRSSRCDYYQRFLREPERADPVLRLGSDGLGPKGAKARSLQTERKRFVMLGNLEPRKNPEIVLSAFEILTRSCSGVEIVFAGAASLDAGFFAKMGELERATGQFRWIENPGDDVVRQLFEQAQATVFVSSAEGFGLPAVESLWLGVPVIAAPDIPSLEEMGEQGICYVERNPQSIADAALALLDADFHSRKVQEAESLTLPTWAAMAQQTEEWLLSS